MDPLRAAPGAETVGNLNALFTSRPFYKAKNTLRKAEIEQRVRELLIDNCAAAWHHSHLPPAYRRIADNLVDAISQELEVHINHQGDAGDNIQLARARQFVEWLDYANAGNIEDPRRYPQIQGFFLYCAHEIQTRLQGALREKCRLILPFADFDADWPGCDDHTRPDISLCTRDIGVNVEHQQNAHYQDTSFIIEVKSHRRLFGEAVKQMGTYMLHMFRNQLDRRDAIGVTLCGTIAKVVVFGHDAVWASTGADLNTGPGRRTLIAQIVDWSLCSTDRLGLDSTIHRGPLLPPAQPAAAGRPPPQPRRVYEIVIDGVSYFSEACRQVVDKLTGQCRRCIPVSENANAVGGPSHLLIGYWPLANHDEAVAISHVNARLRNIVGIRGSYPQVAKSVRVKQQRERGQTVDDDTETAYGALSRIPRNMAAGGRPVLDTHLRRHKRVLINYPGHAISECENEHSAIIAISHAMTTHNALFVVMQILHGDINDNNIVHRMEADEALGILMGYDYAIDPTTGNQRQDQPETVVIQALQSIRSLEDPGAVRTPLDDWESLLYLVCWLGTFGINQAQRAAYIAGLPADPDLPIKTWNQGTATDIANQKRFHMSSFASFERCILNRMRDINGPLSHLAEDIYRALFLHPGCSGTDLIPIRQVRNAGMPVAAPAPGVERDPLVLRNGNANVAAILVDLFDTLARHRDVALAALNAAAANIAGGA